MPHDPQTRKQNTLNAIQLRSVCTDIDLFVVADVPILSSVFLRVFSFLSTTLACNITKETNHLGSCRCCFSNQQNSRDLHIPKDSLLQRFDSFLDLGTVYVPAVYCLQN